VCQRLKDPTVLAVPTVVALLWLLRSRGLIVNLPLWVLVLLLAGSSVLTAAANEMWAEGSVGWRLSMRVGVELAAITVIIYALGWGPTLVVGLVFGVADCMRSVGAAATRPAIIISVVLIGLGQAGIAIGVVPTLVPQPLVQALAILALAGLVFTIQLIGWVFGAKEESDSALVEAEARFRGSFEGAPIGICLVGTDGAIQQVNPAFGTILGYRPDELVGISIEDLTLPEDRQVSGGWTRHLFAGDATPLQIEVRYLHADAHPVWVSLSASCIRDAAGTARYGICQIEDVTERRAMNEMVAHAAIHDPLTDLPNRTLFMDRLRQALERAERGPGTLMVAFVDLDHFKVINDSMGHEWGDRVLRIVAERINEAVRPSDTVARFGGDEFVVLCEAVPDDATAFELAGRITSSLSLPLVVEQFELFVTASVGIALTPGPGTSPERLLSDADSAMYRAKDSGRASIEMYDERKDVWSIGRLRVGNDLHRAITRNEFELHYQPFVDLHSLSLVAVEALIRWRHPTRGLLAPGAFIDLAEDTGLIVPIGAWVLREACRQSAHWCELRAASGAEGWKSAVSINVSPRQLAEKEFPRQMAAMVREAGIDPDHIWLEITEGTLMRDPETSIHALGLLRDLGLHLSIDDFGTGYSSLSYLKQFPVECLKIDGGFIDGLDKSDEGPAIVMAVVALAEALGLACIAEGVETEDQRRTLQDLGCHLAQGFLFGRPLPAEALAPFPTDDLGSWQGTALNPDPDGQSQPTGVSAAAVAAAPDPR
jgi:diguanylate cyclase (GGDEF)-like protein/PAS domain S-box-containing protein